MATVTMQPSKKKSGSHIVKESFPVLEMTCAACAVSVESMLKSTNGVKDASVNFANQTALVEYDTAIAQPVDLQNSIRSIGYDLIVDVEDPQVVKEEAQRKHYEEIKTRTIWSSIVYSCCTCSDYRNVFYEHALRQLHHDGVNSPCGFIFWKKLFYTRLEAGSFR